MIMPKNEKEGASAMPPIQYERLALAGTFEHNLTQSLHEVITSPENVKLLGRFRAAYEYRQEAARLERGSKDLNRNGEGLRGALQEALAVYVPVPLAAQRDSESLGHKVDSTWISDFDKEARDVTDDKLAITQFAAGLVKHGINPQSVSVSELKQHVTEAMENYYARREVDASTDLW